MLGMEVTSGIKKTSKENPRHYQVIHNTQAMTQPLVLTTDTEIMPLRSLVMYQSQGFI